MLLIRRRNLGGQQEPGEVVLRILCEKVERRALKTCVDMTDRDEEAAVSDEANLDDNVIIRSRPMPPDEDQLWRDFEATKATVPQIRSRAETWVTVTAGLTTAFGIGSVLTSVNTLRDIELGWRICYAFLLLVGLGFLLASAFSVFPAFEEALTPTTAELKKMARNKDKKVWKEAALFRRSRWFTLVGFVLIAIASAVSWFAPRDAASDSTTQSGK